MWDHLFTGANIATMKQGAPYGAICDGALGVVEGRIVFCGPATDLPGAPQALARKIEDLAGAWLIPGLIDCHTHLVFAGERSGEFEMRLQGTGYEDISRAGGGILSTVKATRAASVDELVASARRRLDAMIGGGVTTVEIKSGYGLTTEDELKMLEAASRLGVESGARVHRTLLALHALPPEYAGDRAEYVRLVCDTILPEAKRRGLVDAVDAYCETIGFTGDETRRLFDAAIALGVPVKLHAEQLTDQGGAGIAANFRALSADHLEYVNEDDIKAMADVGTIAVLLPGAFYFLKEKAKPPVDLFRKHSVPMALASDCNPGTSPLVSPSLVMNMGCTLFGLTPEEALAGMTRVASAALGISSETGTLETGKAADFAIWRVSRPAEIAYWVGGCTPERVWAGGVEIAS